MHIEDKKELGYTCSTHLEGNLSSGLKADFSCWNPSEMFQPDEFRSHKEQVLAQAQRPAGELQDELKRLVQDADGKLEEALRVVRDLFLDYHRKLHTLRLAADLAEHNIPLDNTANTWQCDSSDPEKETWRISNEVFRLELSLQTHRIWGTGRKPARVEWEVRSRLGSNIRGLQESLADIQKKFQDGDKAMQYLEGRKKFYEKKYFSAGLRPTIPQEFHKQLTDCGLEIPGFAYEDD